MTIQIRSIGVFLPDAVVTNDAWPQAVVAGWMERRAWSPERAERAEATAAGSGAQLVLEAMARASADPFQGSVERRRMATSETAVDMQVEAARRALDVAGITPSDVDFVLGASLVPDLLNAPDACAVHHGLGLRGDCLATSADAVCNSFQMQLALADGLLRTGRGRIGLLLQCSAASRTTPMEQPYSVHFGDGATAVVVAPATEGRGLLAQAHHTDGSIHRAKVVTVPGREWWEEGRSQSTVLDREAARRMFLTFADVGRDLIAEACRRAEAEPKDVAFFACHQATSWWREVVQTHAGLHAARSLDTYPRTGTLSAANLPFILHEAARDGLLLDGDLVCMYQGGTGATYTASVYRWTSPRHDG